MSCGSVMYQSHYSYFPYHRNILDSKQSLTPHEQQRGGGGVDDGGAGRAVETAVTGAIRGTEQPVDGGGQSPSDYNYPSPRHTSPSSFHQGGLSIHGPAGGFPPPPPALREAEQPAFLPGHQHRAPEQQPPLQRSSAETAGFNQNNNNNNNTAPAAVPSLDKVKGEKDGDYGEQQRSAQYLSANCVIFTYYSGEISKVVDDHFSKALSQTEQRESIPLLARNLPPSFFDSSWVGQPSLPPQPHADLYSEYGDPWQSYMASMTGYSAHQMYTARSYSSLLLQSRREWVEQNYPASSYPHMTGLEGGMQSSGTKELYWF